MCREIKPVTILKAVFVLITQSYLLLILVVFLQHSRLSFLRALYIKIASLNVGRMSLTCSGRTQAKISCEYSEHEKCYFGL